MAPIQFVLELSTHTGVNVPIGSIICHTHRLQKTGDITMENDVENVPVVPDSNDDEYVPDEINASEVDLDISVQ